MGKFINPFTDMGFKLIFGQEVSKPIQIEFLNSLLKGERHIKDLKFLNKMRLVYLQLPLFEKEADDCQNTFERIIFVLKNMDILERMPWLAQGAVFQKLESIAEVAALSKEDRQKYDESLRKYRDTISVMEGQYLEGKEAGLTEGMEKGKTEGKFEIARSMKAKGYAIGDITDITGLSADEIKTL